MHNTFARQIEKRTVIENLAEEMKRKERLINEYKAYIHSLDKTDSYTSVYYLNNISPIIKD